MSVLVTGGAGYIGSHVVRLLEQRGDDVVIVDDLSNGIVSRIGEHPLVQVDLAAPEAEDRLVTTMREHEVDSVIHFAAKKQVGESVDLPVWYYRQNVGGLGNLLAAMDRADVDTMVFSSSAATYGMPTRTVITEDTACQPINPYGQTKLIGEWMIDNARVHGLKAVKLRYFNVAGAGWQDLRDTAVMNLIPIIYQRLLDGKNPVVFGDDYNTPDGTCIRDYVHVADLADAHLAALDHLDRGESGASVFNVGTGTGASVLEVIDRIGRTINREVAYDVTARRAGDPPELVADVTEINTVLGWKAQFDLGDIVSSALPQELA